MEVFEQIRLLFIVLMAFLSYRYVNTTLPLPPSIDSQEEEECQNVVENEDASVEAVNEESANLQEPQIEVLQASEQKGLTPQLAQAQVIYAIDSNEDGQAWAEDGQAEPEDGLQDQNQESQMNDEAQYSQNVLGNVENLQNVDPSEKAAKTKRIRKNKKKTTKRSTETIQLADPTEGQYMIV